MRRLLFYVVAIIGYVCTLSAENLTGIIKYDRQSGLNSEVISYTEEQLNAWKNNPESEFRWRLVERKIPDYDAYEKTKKDTIESYKAEALRILEEHQLVDRLLSMLGKSFPDEVHKQYVGKISQLVGDEKDRSSIIKDLNSGKISKKLKSYLISIKEYCGQQYVQKYNDYELINTDWQKFYEIKKRSCPSFSYFTYVDTIENPYNIDYNYKLLWRDEKPLIELSQYYTDKLINEDGWDWYKSTDLIEKNESYPISVSYRYAPDHPEFRFKGNFVYDKNGRLTRVLYPDIEMLFYKQYFRLHTECQVFAKIACIAYNENEYDIKSAGKATNHYVKVQLGLEELTAEEKKVSQKSGKKMTDAFAGSVVDAMKYGTETKEGKSKQREHAMNVLGALFEGAIAIFDSDGSKWLSQIESDYWKFFYQNPPYSIERLGDTSFKIIYADANCNPTFEIIYDYVYKEPYKAEEKITVKKLFDGPASSYKTRQEGQFSVPCAEDFKAGLVSPNDLAQTISSTPIYQTAATTKNKRQKEEVLEVRDVDEKPIFPGGENELYKYISSHMVYPASAVRNQVSGRVFVKFVVGNDGQVGAAYVERGADTDLNNEAIRVVKSLPRFVPAKKDGKPVPVWMSLPLTFRVPN